MTSSAAQSVLVVSTTLDLATDRVVDRLNVLGARVLRINTEEMPFESSMEWSPGGPLSVKRDGHFHTIEPNAIWYRRTRSASKPTGISSEVHRYVVNESYWAIRGVVEAFSEEVRWMSRPSAIDAAECKPLQLALAKKIGFEIPSTRVVSSISDVGRVFREMGPGLVAKPVRSGFLSDGDGGFAMYTTRLTSEMLAASSNAVPTPIIVQKEIVKRSDIRVTVVGTQVFAAEILSQDDPSAIVDWRRTENPDLEHRRIDLPERVQGQCVQLLRGLNLTFGAIDLIRTADDSFVFLEINPSGQWLWIEDQLDYPISNAVADYLLGWIE